MRYLLLSLVLCGCVPEGSLDKKKIINVFCKDGKEHYLLTGKPTGSNCDGPLGIYEDVQKAKGKLFIAKVRVMGRQTFYV